MDKSMILSALGAVVLVGLLLLGWFGFLGLYRSGKPVLGVAVGAMLVYDAIDLFYHIALKLAEMQT